MDKDKRLKSIPDGKWVMCGLCDTAYDPNGPDAKNHEHPEPQSGAPRDAWIASGMKYSAWVEGTAEGREWAGSGHGVSEGDVMSCPVVGVQGYRFE